MKKLKIGVLGATGAVGQEMLKILAEYDIPIAELRPLASARSAGSCISFKGESVPIRAADDDAFEGLDCPRHPQKRSGLHRQQLRLPPGAGCAAGGAGDQRRRRL